MTRQHFTILAARDISLMEKRPIMIELHFSCYLQGNFLLKRKLLKHSEEIDLLYIWLLWTQLISSIFTCLQQQDGSLSHKTSIQWDRWVLQCEGFVLQQYGNMSMPLTWQQLQLSGIMYENVRICFSCSQKERMVIKQKAEWGSSWDKELDPCYCKYLTLT